MGESPEVLRNYLPNAAATERDENPDVLFAHMSILLACAGCEGPNG